LNFNLEGGVRAPKDHPWLRPCLIPYRYPRYGFCDNHNIICSLIQSHIKSYRQTIIIKARKFIKSYKKKALDLKYLSHAIPFVCIIVNVVIVIDMYVPYVLVYIVAIENPMKIFAHQMLLLYALRDKKQASSNKAEC